MALRWIVLGLVSIWLGACATVGGRKQVLLVRSQPAGAKVIYDGEGLGETPALIELPRQSKQELTLERNGAQQVVSLQARYRWKRSFFGNMIFLTLAPVGWLVDWISGSAMEFPQYVDAKFTKQFNARADSKSSKFETRPDRIAIAPPFSLHPNLTDEVGEKAGVQLARMYPQAQILPYTTTFKKFVEKDVDFDSEAKEGEKLPLYFALKVNKIYFSEVEGQNGEVMVKGRVDDLFSPDETKVLNFTIDKKELISIHDTGWTSVESRKFYFAPNTVSLDFTNTRTSLNVDSVSIEAEAEHTEDLWGQVSQYVSYVGIRRLEPPSNRQGWRYKTYFAPTGNFSRAKESFAVVPGLENRTYTRSHADIGYGPNFTYGSKRQMFYFGLVPALAYDDISSNGGSTHRVSRFGLSMNIELGWLYRYSDHWSARFFSRSLDVQDSLWEEIFQKDAGVSKDVSATSLISSGISVGYTFSHSDLSFWDHLF